MVQTALCYVPSFWHNTGVWQADGQTDGIAVASTALAKRRSVKTKKPTTCTELKLVSRGWSFWIFMYRACLLAWRQYILAAETVITNAACGAALIFSERELTFTFAICCRPSVCLSSVTLVRPTQAVQIFGNIFTALGTLAIRWHPLNISRRSSHGNPFRWGS